MAAMTAPARKGYWPWWLILLNGIAAIIIGLLLLASPKETVVLLMRLLGLYWIISGLFGIVSIFVDSTAWGWRLFMGIIGIFAGWVVLDNPLWSAVLVPTTFVWLLGLQGIVIGIISLIEAFRGAGWGAGILGAISIILGAVLLGNAFDNAVMTAMIVAWVGGIFAIVGGIAAIVMSFRVRKEG
jgi:uncharacterized membrane protein HdeD (DUF308 family)